MTFETVSVIEVTLLAVGISALFIVGLDLFIRSMLGLIFIQMSSLIPRVQNFTFQVDKNAFVLFSGLLSILICLILIRVRIERMK